MYELHHWPSIAGMWTPSHCGHKKDGSIGLSSQLLCICVLCSFLYLYLYLYLSLYIYIYMLYIYICYIYIYIYIYMYVYIYIYTHYYTEQFDTWKSWYLDIIIIVFCFKVYLLQNQLFWAKNVLIRPSPKCGITRRGKMC